MNDDLKYSCDHFWFRENADKTVTVGFTDFLMLRGQPECLNLPHAGETFQANEVMGSLEMNKCTIDISLPFAAEILEVNPGLDGDLQLLVSGAMSDGWLLRVLPLNASEMETNLMTQEEYMQFIAP